MSKTQLKKVLAEMTAEQIAELVTDLYDARPEAKEYLDFFIRPDIDSKLEKARQLIRKEVGRISHSRSRMRTTKLKRIIKDISSLNPGDEPVCEIMAYAVEAAVAIDSNVWVKEVTQRAICRLLADTLIAADRAGLLDIYLPRLQQAIANMKSGPFRKNYFRLLLEQSLADTLDTL